MKSEVSSTVPMLRAKLLLLAAIVASACASHASHVTLSGGRITGPFAEATNGSLVVGGLVRMGTIKGRPASDAVADIDAVFEEYGTWSTSSIGRFSRTINNLNSTSFNGNQIYIWIFNAADMDSATEHGVFTVRIPDSPTAGDPWLYPTHIGNGMDSVTISLSSLLDEGDFSITPGASVMGGNLRLARRPPPTSTIEPIESMERTAVGTRLQIPIAFRRLIGIEFSPDGSAGSWIDLGNFFADDDGLATFVDPDPIRFNGSGGFYRAFLRPLHNGGVP